MDSRANLIKVKQVLKFVWESRYSDFYRKKYKTVGINPVQDINSWEDFRKLPFLTKEELLKTDPIKRIYFPKSRVNFVRITSGTSSLRKPLIILSETDNLFSAMKLKTGINVSSFKTPLVLVPVLQMPKVIRLLIGLTPGNWNKFPVIGDIFDLETTAKLSAASNIDSIHTSPTALYALLPYLEEVYDLNKIKYINFRGEYCSEAKAEIFKKKFKHAYLDYQLGNTEGGLTGYRCRYLYPRSPRFYHVLPNQYFEVDDPSGEGEIVMTSLDYKNIFPLLRYKTGDEAGIFQINCKCGNKTLVEVFGRLGMDILKFSGVTLYSFLVEQALVPFSGLVEVGDFQVHVYEEKTNGKITNRLNLKLLSKSVKDANKLKSVLSKEVSKNLYLSSETTLSDLVEKKAFLPLDVELVEKFDERFKSKRLINHII